MQAQDPQDASNVARPFQPGLLRRATELLEEGLDGTAASDRAPVGGGTGDGSLAGIAEHLRQSRGLSARVRQLDRATVWRTAAGGLGVLVPTSEGWLIVTRQGGRLLTETSERSVRPYWASRGNPKAVESVIVVEPRFRLNALSASRTGSTSPWSRLTAWMRLERAELWTLVTYALFLGALSLAVPVAVQVVVNTIAFGALLQPLVILAALLMGVLLLTAAAQLMEWYLVELLQRRLFVRVAEDFAHRLMAVRFDARGRQDLRELSNRFFEVGGLQKAIGALLVDGLGLALQTIVGLLLLGFYHPVLLAFDVALVLCLVAVTFTGWGAVKSAQAESKAKYDVGAFIQAIAGSTILFKRSAGALFAADRIDGLTRGYLAARRHHYRRLFRQLVGGVLVQALAMVSLLGLGGWLVMRGELTLGQLVAAELVIGLIGAGFSKLGKHLESLYDLLAGLDKLGKVLDLPVEPPAPLGSPTGQAPALTLVGLGLRGGGRLGAHLEAGTSMELTGPTGSGKTDLLECLAGLRPVTDGELRVDGLPNQAHCAGGLRQRAYYLGPCGVMEGSVLDNLRLADPNLDETRAWQVLSACGLDACVAALEHGLQTPLLPAGEPLTGGEVARLCVARALVADPDLLLVDGALDALGLEGADLDRLLDAILGTNARRTSLVITRDERVRARCHGVLDVVRGASS